MLSCNGCCYSRVFYDKCNKCRRSAPVDLSLEDYYELKNSQLIMITEKIRKYLEMTIRNVSLADRELQEEVKKELSVLEKLASKQLAMKPNYDERLNNHHCPKCNAKVNRNYCSNCGQKIDWDWS